MALIEFVNGQPRQMAQAAETTLLQLREPALGAEQQRVIAAIYQDCDALVQQVIGGRASEYERAEREAQAFTDVNYTGQAGAMVTSYASAKGWTAQAAAADILQTAATWRAAQAQMRAQRMLRQEEARTAQSVDAVRAAESAWQAFFGPFRAALLGA